MLLESYINTYNNGIFVKNILPKSIKINKMMVGRHGLNH